jgi:ribosomal protein S18 acetylase RimI-like enzyme
MSGNEPRIRRATAADLPAIVALHAEDELGRTREGSADDPAYRQAFARIERDPHNAIYVIEQDGAVIGCAQITIIPGLARRAVTRGQIESVHIATSAQGQGLGRWFFERLIALAKEQGCGLIQLTSDKKRAGAHRFYESLGFSASHEGFKLRVD